MITKHRKTVFTRAARLWGRVSRGPDRSRSVARPVLPVAALVVALSVAFTGTASAQTAFQADVKGTSPRPVACSNGAFFCGTANVAGYGTASWDLYLDGATIVSQTACGITYTATTVFTLASDGSTLVLNESGYICVPGKDGASFFAEGPNSYGNPDYPHGTWTVDTADSTGQFAGLGGSGTDDLHSAGGHAAGSYVGALG
jgi:hypothetical protein